MLEYNAEDINSAFNTILTAATKLKPSAYSIISELKSQALSELSEKEIHLAAGDFTLAEAVTTFGLKFSQVPSESMDYYWNIEKEIGTMEFPMTPGFGETLSAVSRMRVLANAVIFVFRIIN